jgi:hypothetical protein
MSTYTMVFEGFVNVSVCLSALWIDKTGEQHLKPDIKKILLEKFEDNTDILNNLVQKIQTGEDKKAVTEGRHEYAEGRTRKFNTVDEIHRALESS